MPGKNLLEWTIMIYLAGDNNLSSAGERDLEEMRQIGSTDDVNVLAEFDNAGNQGTRRFHIQKDGISEHIVELGETDSGDPAVLIDFVKWVKQNYPAKRYALVLWNHGSGWSPTEIDRIAHKIGTADYNVREASERSASPLGRLFFRTTMEKILALPTASERAICSDDGTGHSLDTIELGSVLHEIKDILGQKLDILGMDACLMSNIEVAYQVRNYAKFLVASEENEPNDGWPYDRFLERVAQDPSLNTIQLASFLVNDYIAFYEQNYPNKTVTQSALNLGRFQEILITLDKLAKTLADHMPQAKFWVWEAKNRTLANFYHLTLWDIGEFCDRIAMLDTNPAIQQAARDVTNVLENADEPFVVAEGSLGDKVAYCRGVTIYHPPKRATDGISPYYPELEFAKVGRWLKLLQAYHIA